MESGEITDEKTFVVMFPSHAASISDGIHPKTSAAFSEKTERLALDLWWDIGKGGDLTRELVEKAVARYKRSDKFAEMVERMWSQKRPLSIENLMLWLDGRDTPMDESAAQAPPSEETKQVALDMWWNIFKGGDVTQEVVEKAVVWSRSSGKLAEMLEQMSSQGVPLIIENLILGLEEFAEGLNGVAVPMANFGEVEDDWELVRELFLRLDLDHDGSVSECELHAAIDSFGSDSEHAAAFRGLLGLSGPFPGTIRQTASIGVTQEAAPHDDARDDAHQVSVGKLLDAFRHLPRVRGERVQWSRTLGLEGEVARLLPLGDLFDGLRGVRELDSTGVQALAARVLQGLQEVIPRLLEAGVARLRGQEYPNAQQLNSKFATDSNAREGDFAELGDFYRGPEALVGTPNPKVAEGIRVEHCVRPNARRMHHTPNYGLLTCPDDEFHFVASPKADFHYPHTPKDRSKWPPDCGWKGECGREHVPMDVLMMLEVVTKAALRREEVLGVRLYSGPMYIWYNARLRKYPANLYVSLEGNQYETTIFCIISAVTKLSKISSIPPNRKLYRGLGGMVLPQVFWRTDVTTGFRGGVEWGLMSTTADRAVALQYSGRNQQRGTVFEIAAGRIDIGADISSLSQYAGEREFLFPPLSCLEVTDEPRVEEGIITVPLRVNLCLKTLTLEQLVERRKELHLAMVRNLREELDLSAKSQLDQGNVKQESIFLTVPNILEDYDKLQRQHALIAAEEFNQDDKYKLLLAEALDAKVKLLQKQQAAIALKQAGASDMQIGLCAAAPWTDFDTQPVEVDWSTIMSHQPEVEIPLLHIAACQVAVLWSVVLKPASPVLRVKMGNSVVKASQFRSMAVSLRRLGLHYDELWVAAAGLVLAAPLARLDVRDINFSELHRAALARAILECPSLASLNDLTVRDREGENLSALVSRESGSLQIFGSCGCLGTKHLRLKDLNVLEWAFIAMKIIIYKWKALNLSRNDLGAGGGTALSSSMGQLTLVQTLDLSGDPFNRDNGLGPEGGTALSSALGQLTSLQTLDLSENYICAEGGTALSTALGQLTLLRILNLSYNNLGQQGASAVSPALAHLTCLLELNICGNDLGQHGTVELSHVLAQLTGLQKLNISDNSLGPGGAAALSPSLAKLTRLQTLHIGWDDNLGDQGATHVAAALPSMPSLTRLGLYRNTGSGIGEAGKAAVRAAALQSLVNFE